MIKHNKLFFITSDGLCINVNQITDGSTSAGGCLHLYINSPSTYNDFGKGLDIKLTKEDTRQFHKFLEDNKFNKRQKKYGPLFWVSPERNKIINMSYVSRVRGKTVYLDTQERYYNLDKSDCLDFKQFMQKHNFI